MLLRETQEGHIDCCIRTGEADFTVACIPERSVIPIAARDPVVAGSGDTGGASKDLDPSLRGMTIWFGSRYT